MKIVQFKDGKYAIQVGIFFKKYIDLNNKYTWALNDTYFKNCKWTKKQCRDYIDSMTLSK